MYEILLSIIIYANHSTKTMYVKKYSCRGRLVNKRQRYVCVCWRDKKWWREMDTDEGISVETLYAYDPIKTL